MSVSSTQNKIIFTGSGTTGPFDFDFKVYASTDLVVEKYEIATGTTTELTETTDYTVTIDGDGTGSISTVAAVTSSYKLIIRRVLPITQAIDYVEGDKFPAETHEEGLDRGVMVAQQLQEQINRAVLQNTSVTTQITLPGAVTGNALAWAADGTLENSDLQGEKGDKGDKGDVGTNGVFSAIASQAEAQAGTENTKGMTALRTAEAIAALAVAKMYPVGIVVTLGVSTNPATLFGIGTWTAIAGKVVVGINAGESDYADGDFRTLNNTGGVKKHPLDITEIPSHSHNIPTYATNVDGGGVAAAGSTSKAVVASASSGGGLAHNNLQPYIVKYVWERTA